jgi:hypothetical protein
MEENALGVWASWYGSVRYVVLHNVLLSQSRLSCLPEPMYRSCLPLCYERAPITEYNVCVQEQQPDTSALHATFQRKVKLLGAAGEDFCQAAADFLLSLLQADPSKRMTAEGAAHHPFLTSPFPEAALHTLPFTLVEDRGVPQNTEDPELWDAIVGLCEEGDWGEDPAG